MQLVRTGDDEFMLVPYQQAHVQNPAEIEHVAGDVSKNGAESDMAQQPAQSAAAAQQGGETYHLGACIVDGVLYATMMRKERGCSGVATVLFSEQIPVEHLQDRDVIFHTTPPATPSAASIAWNALRDLTDPLGEDGVKIMGHVRVFAQRQYEAGLAEGSADRARLEKAP